MAPPLDLRDVRFQRDVQALWSLGPRAIAEFLAELGAERLVRTEIEAKLRRYRRATPAVARGVGADRFPAPVWTVIRK